ncbi:hypothetical protein [Phytohabitans houttuyneae]|uniref:Uncharacterized protein n=1 Tax=Phytohabitans houttuyneae TaxID=1076126 RepID=A0A6V8K2U4_9ACTN|nr:hypothetical protein [Phytohabitans houttuyneae]GFJ79462.1 hypothetical protein Phou_036420 [Phytohabitans houttuyneae]
MPQWNATVEYDGTTSPEDAMTLAGRGDFVVVATDPQRDRTRISFGVTASTLRQATDDAWRQARTVTAGLINTSALSLRIITDHDLAAELERPTVPELVDTTGAREILDVRTHQRMSELEQRDDFPRPVAVVSGGRRIYTAASIKAFAKGWTRKSGRPPRAPRPEEAG